MLSPLVRRLAAESGIDVTTIAGTGTGGRIRREDISNAIAAAKTAPAAPVAPATSAAPTAPAARLLRPRRDKLRAAVQP